MKPLFYAPAVAFLLGSSAAALSLGSLRPRGEEATSNCDGEGCLPSLLPNGPCTDINCLDTGEGTFPNKDANQIYIDEEKFDQCCTPEKEKKTLYKRGIDQDRPGRRLDKGQAVRHRAGSDPGARGGATSGKKPVGGPPPYVARPPVAQNAPPTYQKVPSAPQMAAPVPKIDTSSSPAQGELPPFTPMEVDEPPAPDNPQESVGSPMNTDWP